LRQWRDYCEKFRNVTLPENLYSCGAGVTSFHIDPYGYLLPCLMTRAICYRLSAETGNFLDGWRWVMSRIAEKKIGVDFDCNKCQNRIVCGYCPAFFGMENGREDARSEYLCAMSKHRLRMIREEDRRNERKV